VGDRVRVVLNARAAAPSQSYGRERSAALPPEEFDAALAEISTWPGYAPTPLVSLPGLARRLGVGDLLYKDESGRFGLGSFKPLGGAYAVARLLSRELARRGAEGVTSADLVAGRHAEVVRGITVTSATDGNHGRSVAWGARMFGCRCIIFINAAVSEGREAAIARFGAKVIRVPGSYDDAVRHTFRVAAERGWFVLQDTAFGDYRQAPRDISCGYGVLAAEIMQQVERPPTHVIVPAGVGGVASAVCARFWIGWGERRPRFITLEPTKADCMLRSLAASHRVTISGDVDSVMGGLSCGEVSELAWDILAEGADAAIAIDDAFALEGMRTFADPLAGDPAIVAGECAGGVLGALLALQDRPLDRAALGLDGGARVLLIGTEGATDPEIYTRVVGRTPTEVLAR
jgi:diaminopropionate ammonia-lyase